MGPPHTVSTVCPQANPIVNGIAPIAACTVAFGVYAIMQNSFSCLVSVVFIKDIATPSILKAKAPITSKTANMPAVIAYPKLIIAKSPETGIIPSKRFCNSSR